ncbi:TolC family protein [Sulfuritalea sp.]|uniref:TolC family protein n=1 Tax=Sulfuritalea sp. TaxID=2480090 RepID=UPI00286DA756|nr:TolC family protein [Sulfuritalea sp.]
MKKTLLLLLGLLTALLAHAQNSRYPANPVATPAPVDATATAANFPLTLEAAWQLADQSNPVLNSARANLAAAEGQLADAQGLLWNNPQIAAERLRRTVPDPTLNERTQREWNVGLTQTLEIAGQQGYRRTAAEQELAALRETIEEARRQLRAEVEQKFVRVVSLQLRAEMETGLVDLIKNNSAVTRKRFDAGEDTKLDANLAEVELGRTRNQLESVGEQLIQARADLAMLLQLPAEKLPVVKGALVAKPELPYTLEQLLAAAASRAQLRALDYREQAARNRLGLERAAVYPDVTVGLSSAREGPGDAREKIVGLSVSLPLPLFRRNAAGIGKASAELTQAEIEKQAAGRDTRARVLALWQKLDSLHQRTQRLDQSVLQRLEENQRLSTVAYRAGEISLVQMLLATRQVLDTRREVLEAMTDFALTRSELEQSAGWTGTK